MEPLPSPTIAQNRFDSSMACSSESAFTIAHPTTVSLASVNGPSVIVNRPLRCSIRLPPRSIAPVATRVPFRKLSSMNEPISRIASALGGVAGAAASGTVCMKNFIGVLLLMRPSGTGRDRLLDAVLAIPDRRVVAALGEEVLGFEDRPDLDLGPAVERCLLEPLDRLVQAADLPDPVARDELLGLAEGAVDDRLLLRAVEADPDALRARMEAVARQHHARADELLVEAGHRIHERLVRQLAGLGPRIALHEHHHAHLDLLRSQEPGRLSTTTSNGRRLDRHDWRGLFRPSRRAGPARASRCSRRCGRPRPYAWNAWSAIRSASSASRAVDAIVSYAVTAISPSRSDQEAATRPSTRTAPTENGFLVVNITARWASGRMPLRRAWTSIVLSQCGRKRTGAGVSASAMSSSGRSTSSRPRASAKWRSSRLAAARWRSVTGTPAQLAASRSGAGPNALRYALTRWTRPSSVVAFSGPTHSSASARRSARRRSQVPEGGTRTRSTHSPRLPTNPVASSPNSLTVRGPS